MRNLYSFFLKYKSKEIELYKYYPIGSIRCEKLVFNSSEKAPIIFNKISCIDHLKHLKFIGYEVNLHNLLQVHFQNLSTLKITVKDSLISSELMQKIVDFLEIHKIEFLSLRCEAIDMDPLSKYLTTNQSITRLHIHSVMNSSSFFLAMNSKQIKSLKINPSPSLKNNCYNFLNLLLRLQRLSLTLITKNEIEKLNKSVFKNLVYLNLTIKEESYYSSNLYFDFKADALDKLVYNLPCNNTLFYSHIKTIFYQFPSLQSLVVNPDIEIDDIENSTYFIEDLLSTKRRFLYNNLEIGYLTTNKFLEQTGIYNGKTYSNYLGIRRYDKPLKIDDTVIIKQPKYKSTILNLSSIIKDIQKNPSSVKSLHPYFLSMIKHFIKNSITDLQIDVSGKVGFDNFKKIVECNRVNSIKITACFNTKYYGHLRKSLNRVYNLDFTSTGENYSLLLDLLSSFNKLNSLKITGHSIQQCISCTNINHIIYGVSSSLTIFEITNTCLGVKSLKALKIFLIERETLICVILDIHSNSCYSNRFGKHLLAIVEEKNYSQFIFTLNNLVEIDYDSFGNKD